MNDRLQAFQTTPDSICELFSQLKRNDNITYWSKAEWQSAWSTPGKVAPGGVRKLKPYDFLEDELGALVNGERRAALCEFAELCYTELLYHARESGGHIIETWSRDASMKALNFIAINLYPRFPELRLCEGDWKLQAFLIQHYPSWMKNRKQEAAALKQEIRELSLPPPGRTIKYLQVCARLLAITHIVTA